MTTVVNNPAPEPEKNSGGMGFLIGIILLIAFISALLYFGIPAIKRMGPIQIQANIPTPQINVPSNVNVTTPTPAK
jgi:hypothetical protein